ncbi:MAG: DUF2796 domain-containing protein [Pseudomonadota bacterium]
MRRNEISNSGLLPLLSGLGLATLAAHTAAEGAHVHGEAELALVQSANTLEIELNSPAVNILGFEHKATEPAELTAVANAEQALEQSEELFTFSGTSCELQAVNVDMSAIMNVDDDSDKDHHRHEDVEADDKHGHDEHDHEKHNHDDHGHDASTHGDITAQYTYGCTEGDALETVRVGSEGLPFDVETINAMWVTDSGQGAAVLISGQQVIRLR